MWVIGGQNIYGNLNDAWYSYDGINCGAPVSSSYPARLALQSRLFIHEGLGKLMRYGISVGRKYGLCQRRLVQPFLKFYQPIEFPKPSPHCVVIGPRSSLEQRFNLSPIDKETFLFAPSRAPQSPPKSGGKNWASGACWPSCSPNSNSCSWVF